MRIKDMPRPGTELLRIVLVNWYGFSRLDIEVRGNVALIGRNGAGKSSIIDAVQLVLSGGNKRYFAPNASAEVTSGASRKDDRRSVLDYCVGKVNGVVLRPEAVSYIALVFRGRESDEVLTAGMAFSAREGDAQALELGSFIAKDFDLTTADFIVNGRTREYSDFETAIRKARGGARITFLRNKPGEFAGRLLRDLTDNAHLDPETYLRALKNSLAFKAMDDPTEFVRGYVLPPPGLSSSKIEGLRRSYANWRAIEERIAKAGAQQDVIEDISTRLATLVEKKRETSRWSVVEALANESLAVDAQRGAIAATAKAEQGVKQAQVQLSSARSAISDLDRTIAIAQAELGEQQVRDEIAGRRSDQKRADGEIVDAQARRARIVLGLMGASALRPQIAEETDVLDASTVLREIELFAAAAERGDSIDRVIRPLVAALDGFSAKADLAENDARDDIARLKLASAEDRESLRRFRSGGALVGDRTSALVADLKMAGIVADPLCSLVEMVDERWRDAAETLLGNAREALIVNPSDVSRAIRVMDEGGGRYQGCLIYDAKEQDRASPSPARGTLASMLRTDNPYARAFLNTRIGNVRCVEDREDLRLHQRAVTASVLAKGGGAIYKPHMPRNRLLGLTAQEGSADELQRRIDKSVQDISALTVRSGRLRRIASGVDAFMASVSDAAGLADIEQQLVDAMNRSEAAAKSVADLERSLSSDRFESLRLLESDREGHLADQIQDEQDLADAASALGQARERLIGAEARLAIARDKLAHSTTDVQADVSQEAADLFGKLVNARGGAAPVAKEARAAIDAGGGRLEQRLQAVRQEAANYARDFNVDFDAGDTIDDLEGWIARCIGALEGDVLSKYREQATIAREEMEKSIYDDFILNLANDLQMGRERVKLLNRTLSAQSFNGERFQFTVDEHRDYVDVVALSRAVVSSERSISDLFDAKPERPEDMSDGEERGIRRIRTIFEGGGDVDHFTDYRNYLKFDLVSYDAQTGARISGAKERSKRSGGERQVPFYIAMASAMASICYRGRRRGMGFAMFDEAFNALDNANISSSLGMMQQLGLQFLLSAPTEKASAFIPHVDTVVTVSRFESFCQIDVEYPSDHARDQMLALDPSISGIAALRPPSRPAGGALPI